MVVRAHAFAGLCVLAVASGCGGSSTPSAPTPPKTATVQATVTSVNATFAGVQGNRLKFDLATSVTFRESGGVSATIQRVTGTVIMQPTGETLATGSLDVALPVAAGGTATDAYTQSFEVSSDATGATWRLTATGVDASGRAFTVQNVEVPISFPAPPPPARNPGPERISVYGGPNYGVYLGCFNCNEFNSESVWNEFSTYGSPFSSTSINNEFSQYGSTFSTYSACNEFASRPPVLVDSRTFYGELTLNQFRPRAIRDSNVLVALRALCAG